MLFANCNMKFFLFVYVLLFHNPYILCGKENKTVRIELFRQKSPMEQYINDPDRQKYGLNFNWLHKEPRTNDSIALYRYLDSEFYGKIVIGHPGQTLNVAFDTAWSLSWVLSSQCNLWRTVGCWFHNRYDHKKSSEWKKDGRPYVANEGSYNLTGFYSYDNISIAHSNVTTQSFVEMVQVPYTFLFNKADGVLGLGLREGSYEPFFYKLLRQKKIRNPIFSIFLNRDRQSSRGGIINLGFIDDKHIHVTVYPNKSKIYDEIKYLPVDPGQYWQFQVDSVTVAISSKENYTLCPEGCKAMVDTSTSTIVGPEEDVKKIHETINAKYFLFNRYTVDCDTVNKLPKIDFILGGQAFRLTGSEYTVKMSYASFTVCVSSFIPTATPFEEGLWVLGGAFLSEYYSIYNIDSKLIGFVRAA